VRAIPIYRKCGFIKEATLRERSFKEGKWIDHVVMSVNRDEFEEVRREWDGGFVTQDSNRS